MDKTIVLRDMNEEEDRDREILNQFMKKFAKIWKFLFGRYSNQAYSGKNKNADFDALEKKFNQINQAEINKMLRDHNTYPQLISKEEIAHLIRLVNMHYQSTNSSDISMLDYPQFLAFIP